MKMKNSGFTLIEGMIVLAIFAILASIAYPAYLDYKCKGSYSDHCKGWKHWKTNTIRGETGVSSPQTACSHGLLFDAKGNQVIGTDGKGVQCL